jgi:hypothetical protein
MNTTTEIKRTTLTATAAAKLHCSQTHRCTDSVVVVLSYQFADGARLNHYPLCESHQGDYSRDSQTLRAIKEIVR